MYIHGEIKEALLQWLKSKGLSESALNKEGRCVMQEKGRGEYLLWIPDAEQALLHVVMELKVIDDQHELELVLLANTMNLDPTLLGNSCVGYHPGSRQLMLRTCFERSQITPPERLDQHIAKLHQRAQLVCAYLERFRNRSFGTNSSARKPILDSFSPLSATKAGLFQSR